MRDPGTAAAIQIDSTAVMRSFLSYSRVAKLDTAETPFKHDKESSKTILKNVIPTGFVLSRVPTPEGLALLSVA